MKSFRNHQWQLTKAGLETVDRTFGVVIPRTSLLAIRRGRSGSFYEWPLHMAEKTWLDFAAFEEAFRVAVSSCRAPVDPATLDLSIEKGRAAAHLVQHQQHQKL